MRIALFEGYRKHPRRRRKKYGAHRKSKRRSYRGRATPKQAAHRAKFRAAIKSCKAIKGKAKYKCISNYFKRR